MPIYDHNSPYQGSGSPIVYGGMAVAVPPGVVRRKGFKWNRTDDIVYIEPSGATPSYFATLNSRYKVDPSGWNS